MPLSVAAFAIAIVMAVALSPTAAAWLHTRRPVALLTLLGFGLVLSATLVPTAAALDGITSDGVCDLSRVSLAPIEELMRVTSTSLNVLLFVPLGMAVGLLPRTRTTALVALAAFSLTFVVETVQLVVTPLGRGCQTADIFDNLLGLAIGLGIGIVGRRFLSARPDSRG